MADRDRAAIDVELILVEAQFAYAGEDLSAEGLVDLDPIDGVELHPDSIEQRPDRRRRADAHDFGRAADSDGADQLGDRLLALGFQIGAARHDHAGGADDHARGIAACLHAAEGWTNFGERLAIRRPGMRVFGDALDLAVKLNAAVLEAFAMEDFRSDSRDLLREKALGAGAKSPFEGPLCISVDFRPDDLVLLGEIFRRSAHRDAAGRVE